MKNILIIVLGGWIVQEKGVWRTTTFENDTGGPETQGDRLRVLAAAHLYRQLSDEGNHVRILASGGRGKLEGISDVPNIADVNRLELIGLGVTMSVIQTDVVSGSTFEQLKTLVSFMSGSSEIMVISNEYHLPRIRAMIQYLDALSPLRSMFGDGVLQIVSAESVLEKLNPNEWNATIEAEIYHTPGMKKRIAAEQRGVTQLQKGAYGHE